MKLFILTLSGRNEFEFELWNKIWSFNLVYKKENVIVICVYIIERFLLIIMNLSIMDIDQSEIYIVFGKINNLIITLFNYFHF